MSYPDAEMFNYRPDGQMKRAPVDLSIYLNRPTKWIADPVTLPRTDRPQIYVTPEKQERHRIKARPRLVTLQRDRARQ